VGSGVIIDTDGIVLTNNHVVEGADVVTVRTSDGREFTATDIKTDPESDVAVVRLKDAKNLTAAKLGNSDELEIGDWVIAIGNPFELEMTVSAGIISGKGRELGAIRRSKFLQTDAAINPGNSGGPLVNLDGEVIGINTAIASSSGGYQGIGFAIPSNHVRWIMDQLIKTGSVKRGYLGVKIEPLNKDLAENFGLATKDGVLINEVFPDSPAASAGMQDGDVVLKLNGAKVANPRDLQEGVERAPIDSSLPLVILRDGKQMTLNVKVKALPENFAKMNTRSRSGTNEVRSQGEEVKSLGLSISEMNSSHKKTYEGQKGVIVTDVDEDGPAAQKGLSAGMLIRKVDGKSVTTVKEFTDAIARSKSSQGVLLEVRTENGNHFVVLKPTT
jgi:serine protease Do